ncbi:MAG: type II toxin-antitoxin system VapC family toxin [Candidatus Nanohalobium sp.]
MSKLLDTWAWIEFYDGTEIGQKIYSLIQGEEKLFTSEVTIAELSDNYHLGNFQTDHTWQQVRGFIETNSEVLKIDSEIASKAGKIKAEERKNKPDFGLMDALILATARKKDLKLLTGDPHLTSQETAANLKK